MISKMKKKLLKIQVKSYNNEKIISTLKPKLPTCPPQNSPLKPPPLKAR